MNIFDNKTLDKNEQLSSLSSKNSDNNIKKYGFYLENASDFEITAIADLNDLVEESNESNNALRKTIKINKKPILNPINNFTVNETETIKINLTALDLNEDSLNYSINFSKFKKISNSNDDSAVFEWKTTTVDSGSYTFIGVASDGWLNDSFLFSINVVDKPEIDFDNDGMNDSVDKVVGEVKDINTSTINSSIIIDGYSNLSRIFNETLEVRIKDSNITVVEFEFNFSNINFIISVRVFISRCKKTLNE